MASFSAKCDFRFLIRTCFFAFLLAFIGTSKAVNAENLPIISSDKWSIKLQVSEVTKVQEIFDKFGSQTSPDALQHICEEMSVDCQLGSTLWRLDGSSSALLLLVTKNGSVNRVLIKTERKIFLDETVADFIKVDHVKERRGYAGECEPVEINGATTFLLDSLKFQLKYSSYLPPCDSGFNPDSESASDEPNSGSLISQDQMQILFY